MHSRSWDRWPEPPPKCRCPCGPGQNCVDPVTPPLPITKSEPKDAPSDAAFSAIVSIVDKLQAANDANAQLREKLAQIEVDRQRHENTAFRATQFADQLQQDNVRLKSDLSSWEDRLKQLESLAESRQTHQADALGDIEFQLDQLIATYEDGETR